MKKRAPSVGIHRAILVEQLGPANLIRVGPHLAEDHNVRHAQSHVTGSRLGSNSILLNLVLLFLLKLFIKLFTTIKLLEKKDNKNKDLITKIEKTI